MPERLYSTYQVARLLGESPQTVADWMQKGWLPFKKLPGGLVRIPGMGLIHFLKERGIDLNEVMTKIAQRDGQSEPAGAAPEPVPAAVPAPGPSVAVEAVADAESAVHRPEAKMPSRAPIDPGPREAPDPPDQDLTEAPPVEQAASPPKEGAMETISPVDAASQVARALLSDAAARGAGDIHLESRPDGISLRLRIDGVLQDKPSFKVRLPAGIAPKLVAHFKSLTGLNPAQTRLPQAGPFAFQANGREVRCELACLPTIHGERLTIRLRDAAPVQDLSALGLDAAEQAQWRHLVAEPGGIILVIGHARSGKDLTLRALAAELNTPERSVATIERSVLAAVPGLVQCRVDRAAGLRFAEAMRALADCDGDAIMTDDIPDPATGLALMDAAEGGKIVLAGMNVRGPVEAVAMLLEMNLEPWPLSMTLRAIIQPRIVRRLCADCRKQVVPSPDVLSRLALRLEEVNFPVYCPQGCTRCAGGYRGTTGLFSVTRVEGPVARAIRLGAPENLPSAVGSSGTKPLRQVALGKLRAGVTSLEELERVGV